MVSMDLISLSKSHIQFLQELHTSGISITRPTNESLRRYCDLWLPLVKSLPDDDTKLIPPADIAWLWHCHRLAPYRYESYLKCRFGNDCDILEANPPFTLQFDDDEESSTNDVDDRKIQLHTQRLWNERYPQEPFFLTNESSSSSSSHVVDEHQPPPPPLLDGFDLLSSTDRQGTFLWQVSSPRFNDESFVREGLINYIKFLQLKKHPASANQIIVPTYQIDLLWHTHILSSLKSYHEDCRKITGKTLHHDDSLNDRSVGGTLDISFKQTKALWKQMYNEDYYIEGGMYRGEPPKEYYHRSWSPNHVDCNKNIQTPTGPYVGLINLQGASSTTPADGNNVVSTTGAYAMQIRWCWKETQSQISKHPTSSIVGPVSDCWVAYDPKTNDILEQTFQKQKGFGTCDLMSGHTVDFNNMKQIKISTGYERDVQRVVQTGVAGAAGAANATAADGSNVSSSGGGGGFSGVGGGIAMSSANTAETYNNFVTSEPAKIWCWKETLSKMSMHPPKLIVGDPTNCWVKYNEHASATLEAAYQAQNGRGTCSPMKGYTVDFAAMTQAKDSTGYLRDVRRIAAGSKIVATPNVWCWQETEARISRHPSSSIVGNPADCWVKYDGAASAIIDSAYQSQQGKGTCSPISGYTVDFATMKQIKDSTGYERNIRRVADNNLTTARAAGIDASGAHFGSTPGGQQSSGVLSQWTSVYGTAPDGQPGFIPSNSRSTTKGVNANPKKTDYIFGTESKGLGYYHITTQEAYKILLKRVHVRAMELGNEVQCLTCGSYLFLFGFFSKPSCVSVKEDELDELNVTRDVIKARAEADVPFGQVGIPPAVQNDQGTVRKYYSDTGMWFFPHCVYDAGGGCGATGGAAGCGGGGACGAAACGGGGCGGGGGGCGGGGCGGGG